MLKIRSMTDGFRRCGMAFTREWQIFDDGLFTDDEVAQLRGEPMLDVQHVEPDADEVSQDLAALKTMTRDALKSKCDAMGVEYPASATKADLIDWIQINTAPKPGE